MYLWKFQAAETISVAVPSAFRSSRGGSQRSAVVNIVLVGDRAGKSVSRPSGMEVVVHRERERGFWCLTGWTLHKELPPTRTPG